MTTKEQFINKRIKLKDIEEYKKVVELAISLGFTWQYGDDDENNNSFHKYLFFLDDMRIIHSDDDDNWRDDMNNSYEKIEDISDLFIETKQIIDEDNLIVFKQEEILTISKEDNIIEINEDTFLSLAENNLIFKENKDEFVELTEKEIKLIRSKL